VTGVENNDDSVRCGLPPNAIASEKEEGAGDHAGEEKEGGNDSDRLRAHARSMGDARVVFEEA
jgi:hypothetical protein